MNRARTGFLILCLVVVGLVLTEDHPPVSAGENRAGGHVMLLHVDGDRLTLRLKDAPLKTVLEVIGKRTGIRMTIQGSLPPTVSAEFRDLPLEEGLRRLLKDCGWLAVGRRNGTVEEVVVVGVGNPTRPTPKQEARLGISAKDAAAPAPPRTVAELVERESVRSSLDILLHDPDPTAKVDAIQRAEDSLKAEEVGLILDLLRDGRPSQLQAALEPLAGLASPEERAAMVKGLQSKQLRQTVVDMLGPIQLYKAMQEERR